MFCKQIEVLIFYLCKQAAYGPNFEYLRVVIFGLFIRRNAAIKYDEYYCSEIMLEYSLEIVRSVRRTLCSTSVYNLQIWKFYSIGVKPTDCFLLLIFVLFNHKNSAIKQAVGTVHVINYVIKKGDDYYILVVSS